MFNVCPGCGEYSVDKTIDRANSMAVCKQCGHRHPFKLTQLMIVTGASGTGKTAVALELTPTLQECVCMESDILWSDEFNKPEDDYSQYRNLWLRVAKNVAQSGRPVVLFGTSTPGQFEKCEESRYFSGISYLAFVCDELRLKERLRSRPGWRKSGSEEVLERMIGFNKWLIDNAAANEMTLLDTSEMTLAESAEATKAWITSQI